MDVNTLESFRVAQKNADATNTPDADTRDFLLYSAAFQDGISFSLKKQLEDAEAQSKRIGA